MELERRVALVTGGGTGLGAEVCRRLAARGARVAINWSRSREQAEALAGELDGHAVEADVRDERAVADMVARVRAELGPVDLLVNNAGVTRFVPYVDLQGLSAGDWEWILGVNLIGAWSCVRAVAPDMRERAAGSIVNVASDAAFTLDGSSIAYTASKVALAALTTMLAQTLAPHVRVNAVAPGWMLTPWVEKYVPADPRASLDSGEEPVVPVGDVADEVVRLLADDDATGRIVRMDPPS